MTYESLEVVELGQAEGLIEIGDPSGSEESPDKFLATCAPYVEFSEE